MPNKQITANAIQEDKELILRAQKDPSEFRGLYEKYYKKIFLFVYARVCEQSIAADLTSQAFLKALVHLPRYKVTGAPFASWLFRIALNECLDYFRRSERTRFVSIEHECLQGLHHEMTHDYGLEELEERLPELLAKLKPDELHIVELRYFEQRPFKEVADILGITETYAKVRIYRVLDKMKKLFTESSVQ